MKYMFLLLFLFLIGCNSIICDFTNPSDMTEKELEMCKIIWSNSHEVVVWN